MSAQDFRWPHHRGDKAILHRPPVCCRRKPAT